ncbi:glycosyltransferase, partial [Nitrospira sp. BLG_2]|uniref:glycosyltransferase n=1 Tax=Nitrospira sp. BLG_2 TaxID=3397507 RepID=UPI003B9BC645
GKIVWIPVCFHVEERALWSLPRRMRLLTQVRKASASMNRRSTVSRMWALNGNLWGHLRYPVMIFSERLIDALKAYHVDLLIFHWLSYDTNAIALNALRHKIPYVIVNHFDNSRLSEKAARRVAKEAIAVGGVSSRNVPSELQQRFVNLSDAVDVDFFSSALAKAVPRQKGFRVLLPGRIAQGKGHRDLLLAVEGLGAIGKNMSIVFAGATESELLMSELSMMVSDFRMEGRVSFLGELKPDELRDWYAASDLVVLPSASEGLGRVLIEAQAMGKPVIAYEAGGVPEAFIHGKTGFLVKKGDHAALGERIGYLFDRPAERITMGESGRRFVVERYAVKSLINRHEELYCETLSRER